MELSADLGWVVDHLDELAYRTVQHLLLAGLAVAFGFADLVRAGRRSPCAGGGPTRPILAVSDVLYTIPSLAIFATLVSITGITLLTVEIPLVMYTLVIFVRNIAAGFDSVPADVIDAADGLGYTRGQRLWRVEIPLAVPLDRRRSAPRRRSARSRS